MKQTPMMKAIEKFEHALAYNVEGSNKVEPYSWNHFCNDLCELLAEERDFAKDNFIVGSNYGMDIISSAELGKKTTEPDFDNHFTQTYGGGDE